jgi:hypothetical protein
MEEPVGGGNAAQQKRNYVLVLQIIALMAGRAEKNSAPIDWIFFRSSAFTDSVARTFL